MEMKTTLTGKNVEIFEKDIVRPKLTLAKDRVTIKFPLAYFGDKKLIANRFLEIARYVGDVAVTLRGQLTTENTICMRDHNGKVHFHFKIGSNGVLIDEGINHEDK